MLINYPWFYQATAGELNGPSPLRNERDGRGVRPGLQVLCSHLLPHMARHIVSQFTSSGLLYTKGEPYLLMHLDDGSHP